MVELLALVVSGMALLAALVALVYSRDAADAAQTSADSLERLVEDWERSQERLRAGERRTRVSWQLSLGANGFATLRNTGTGSAHDVRVTVAHALRVQGESYDKTHVQAGESMRFWLHAAHGLPDDVVEVGWCLEPGGRRDRWVDLLGHVATTRAVRRRAG